MWYFSAGANIGYQTPNVSDDNGNAVFIINREAIAPSTVAFRLKVLVHIKVKVLRDFGLFLLLDHRRFTLSNLNFC